MNLTLEKLKSLYQYKDNIFKNKNELSNRFDEINEIIDEFVKIDIEPYKIRIHQFTSNHEGILDGNSKSCYSNMLNKETDGIGKGYINKCWKLIAGYNKNENPIGDFRIISNNFTKADYHGNLSFSDISSRVNGNFASNNYFFQIADFLKNSTDVNKKFNELIETSKIVLTWKGSNDLGGDSISENEAFNKSTVFLKNRFPPKFLWMWANKESVLHPFSLSAFQNFLDTKYGKDILKEVDPSYTPESVTNADFDTFTDIWKKISDKIIGNVKGEGEQPNEDIIPFLSKLISLISINETDIKNIEELLQTGNQAVILWGAPGTGKTYESMQVIKRMLAEDIGTKDFENEYLFSKNEGKLDYTHGYYEMIQFHPNYTYEDFIGGIQPSLNGSGISYELKHGVFKRFCDAAKKAKNNFDKNKSADESNKNEPPKYIFVIDEINRAELSAVFGELLFSLEYRNKTINLPHFGEFEIPSNVYLIGTMNNVDKSLVTFDLALRRRFGFLKLEPNLKTLNDMEELNFLDYENKQKFITRADELNTEISKKLNLDDDYKIGQAYFKKIIDFIKYEENTVSNFALEKLWEYHLYSLLEEYLGASIDDDSIGKKLKSLKDDFIKDLS